MSTTTPCTSTANLNFESALGYLKAGRLIARSGWNGANMFLYLVPGSSFEVNRPPLNTIFSEGTVINYQAHIDMRTADGSCVPWVASQSDLLANDWFVLPIGSPPVI